MSTPNTVLLKIHDEPFILEAPLNSAATPITPGMLLQRTSYPNVAPHATAGVAVDPLYVATEFAVDGRGINDKYTVAGESVDFAVLHPGEWFYGLVYAGAVALVAGDLVASHGDGYVAKVSANVAVARAIEAVDNSAGITPARIRLEAL